MRKETKKITPPVSILISTLENASSKVKACLLSLPEEVSEAASQERMQNVYFDCNVIAQLEMSLAQEPPVINRGCFIVSKSQKALFKMLFPDNGSRDFLVDYPVEVAGAINSLQRLCKHCYTRQECFNLFVTEIEALNQPTRSRSNTFPLSQNFYLSIVNRHSEKLSAAIRFLELAAYSGHADAVLIIGRAKLFRRVVWQDKIYQKQYPYDEKGGVKLLTDLVESKRCHIAANALAAYYLWICDIPKAVEWLIIACECGCKSIAPEKLQDLFANGYESEFGDRYLYAENKALRKQLLGKFAEHNVKRAMSALGGDAKETPQQSMQVENPFAWVEKILDGKESEQKESSSLSASGKRSYLAVATDRHGLMGRRAYLRTVSTCSDDTSTQKHKLRSQSLHQ